MASVFYNILDLAGINARILFKEQQQQESPEESPAAAGRGAEGRIHGGERGRGSRHKVGSSGSKHHNSSRHGDGDSAGPKELQTEPNVGHLKCHKPMCVNSARRAEVIWLWPVIKRALFFVSSFFDYYYFLLYIIKYYGCSSSVGIPAVLVLNNK